MSYVERGFIRTGWLTIRLPGEARRRSRARLRARQALALVIPDVGPEEPLDASIVSASTSPGDGSQPAQSRADTARPEPVDGGKPWFQTVDAESLTVGVLRELVSLAQRDEAVIVKINGPRRHESESWLRSLVYELSSFQVVAEPAGHHTYLVKKKMPGASPSESIVSAREVLGFAKAN